jgi:GT2 family glycosyltransferase
MQEHTTVPAAGEQPAGVLSLGASIVLYRTAITDVLPLIGQLLQQGASRVYLIDNSPPGFDAFGDWRPPEQVTMIITRMNLGYGRANNLAIRDSVRRHKYHLICNPDITLGPGVLPQLCARLDREPAIGLCGPRILGPDGTLQHLCKRAPSVVDLAVRRFAPDSWFRERRHYYEMRDHSYDQEMEPLFLSGCFMLFRCPVLERLGGFDERFFLYLEDLDLSRRAQEIARNLYYPNNHVVHVHERGAHKSLRLLMYFGMSVLRYFNKWGWLQRRSQ